MTQDLASTTLSPLKRADGSASYSANGYSVVCAVNGPVEVQRRDELPEEAAIDVVIRPIIGVGGIREKHFETLIGNTLRHIILVTAHPRTLIQVTIQVTGTPSQDSTTDALPQAASNLSLLPALLQVAALALLTTSISLSMTLTSTLFTVNSNGDLLTDPVPSVLEGSSSIHVLAFSSFGDLLVIESEGDFDLDTLERVLSSAQRTCYRPSQSIEENEDVDMEGEETPAKDRLVKGLMESRIAKEQRWKQQKVS